jgi:hypothetical protein
MVESQGKRARRLVETLGAASLVEAQEGQPRRIKAVGITAGVVNGNGRRYPAGVLEAAVLKLKTHLHESAGQGRLVGERPEQLLGEVEHPSDKGGRPNLLETVVKWEAVNFDGAHVLLEGMILPTSKGRDILALMEGGVQIPISQRAFGDSKMVKDGGQKIEEITVLDITGYDLVAEASDPVAAINESKLQQEEDMDPEELKKLISQHPEWFDGLLTSKVESMNASQLQAFEAKIRQSMGLDETADLGKALTEATQAKKQLDEQKNRQAVEAAIAEHTKDLPYAVDVNAVFVESVKAANPQTPEGVKVVCENLRKAYDSRAANGKLAGMGFKAERVQVGAPVIEEATGHPAFARAAFELSETIRKVDLRPRRDFRQPKTVNEEFAALVLKRYDELYQRHLVEEALRFEEAELSTDLSLPYSVTRAVIAEAFPTLVAAGVFDVGLGENAKQTTLYYEAFAGETGYSASIGSTEALTADLDDWVSMANARITPGTVVVKNHAEAVTYTEGTDYVIDYANGRLMALSTGSITNGQDLHITAYSYTAIRKGENTAIEYAKLTITSKTVNMAADRLATKISKEAIVFSRTSFGWDATARTLASLVRQVARKVDQGLIYAGISAALQVASNSGGTWTASTDPLDELVEKLGVAKVKVLNRYYTPTFALLSMTNADKLAGWDGFTAAGSRADATLNADGYVGRVKGLNVFQSTEMSDSYVLIGNRELVLHRIGQPMQIAGPFPTYDTSTGELIASDQYYAEEFNATDAPVPQKGSYVKIA